MLSLQIVANIFILPRVILTIVRKAFRIVKYYTLTEFAPRIFFFDIHCNNFKKWLGERGYSERLVRKEILKARSQPRETLFTKEKMSRNDGRVTCTITYYTVFKNIRIVLEELLFYLHQMSSIRKFLQIFSEQVSRTAKV